MIDGETWDILAERLRVIRWLSENQDETDVAELVFDSDDQARLA